jgi:hypothetical protein
MQVIAQPSRLLSSMLRFYCVDTDGVSITQLKRAHVEQKQWSFYNMDPFQDQLPRADLLLSRDIGEVRMHAYVNLKHGHSKSGTC